MSMNVGSVHEGFPYAIALSQKGYNAFVLQYRVGGERIACEDLAAALSYIFKNAGGWHRKLLSLGQFGRS
jgi:hypothetical protein